MGVRKRLPSSRSMCGHSLCQASNQMVPPAGGNNFGIITLNCIVGLASMSRQSWVFFYTREDCILHFRSSDVTSRDCAT